MNKVHERAKRRASNLDIPFEELKYEARRYRVIYEQSGSCNRCRNDKWLDQPIVLEIDHIDGDGGNNSRENLEALCPNCHSLTPTWRGRNKKNTGKQKVTDEQIRNAVISNPTIYQALLSLGLAPKGNNYARIKKVMEG